MLPKLIYIFLFRGGGIGGGGGGGGGPEAGGAGAGGAGTGGCRRSRSRRRSNKKFLSFAILGIWQRNTEDAGDPHVIHVSPGTLSPGTLSPGSNQVKNRS